MAPLFPGGIPSLPAGWESNCSGPFKLDLSQQVHRMLAIRLVELASKQGGARTWAGPDYTTQQQEQDAAAAGGNININGGTGSGTGSLTGTTSGQVQDDNTASAYRLLDVVETMSRQALARAGAGGFTTNPSYAARTSASGISSESTSNRPSTSGARAGTGTYSRSGHQGHQPSAAVTRQATLMRNPTLGRGATGAVGTAGNASTANDGGALIAAGGAEAMRLSMRDTARLVMRLATMPGDLLRQAEVAAEVAAVEAALQLEYAAVLHLDEDPVVIWEAAAARLGDATACMRNVVYEGQRLDAETVSSSNNSSWLRGCVGCG